MRGFIGLLIFSSIGTWAVGQDEPEERLIDRPPFDQVVLREEAGGQVLDVFSLDVPRPLRTLPNEGDLKVRLLNRPAEEFVVSWRDVAEVRLYEQVLFTEARRLTAAGKFDDAFDYFSQLEARYSSTPGLGDAINEYLRDNALALYKAKQNDRAMAVLASLASRNPKFAGLSNAVDTVAGEMIEQHLREQDYAAARGVLDLWQSQFKAVGTAGSDAWQRRFETAALRQIADAKQLVAQQDYIGARRVVGRAVKIWPNLAAAEELLAQIRRDFPSVMVGVFEASPREPKHQLDNWAALRTSRLVNRLLVEQVGFNTEGGEYRSPYAELIPDESGTRLTLKLRPFGAARDFTTDQLIRYLLRMADPHDPMFRGDFASILAGISVPALDVVQLDWTHPYVRPEALLQVPPPPATAAATTLPAASDQTPRFRLATIDGENVVFAPDGSADSAAANNLRTIIERTFTNDDAAVAALLAGEVDVLDRVPPWHLERLRTLPGIRVEAYTLPTVHVLIPNFGRPLLEQREFRRALCFGINRDWIVRKLLLGGAEMVGFEVVSGPFPAGFTLGDPIRYAYNNQITPRPFEPRLAAILATVAWANVLDPEGKGKTEITEIPELVLAHPSDPVIRVACQTIEQQLDKEGVPVRLLECTTDDLASGRVECDLRYAELAVWEPLVDARPILGPNGLAKRAGSPYLDAALRGLDDASNWKDIRTRLSEIHEIAHQDLPMIPLWQTANYFAYRTTVRGIGESPMTLYQDAQRWSTASGENIAGVAPANRGDAK